MNKFYSYLGQGVFATLIVGVILVFVRVIGVALVWLSGKIIEWIFGGYITDGINAILPNAHFTASLIPVAAVILYVIGSFVYTSSASKSTYKGESK